MIARYNFDERSGGKSRTGAWVAFDQFKMVNNSAAQGWALARSLQTQVDILTKAVKRAALPEMPEPKSYKLYESLYNIRSDAYTTLQALAESNPTFIPKRKT